MSASLRASTDGTQAIIAVGGVDKLLVGTSTVQAISAGGLGYGTGAGGTVTQVTAKSTAVTLNKPAGRVITAADALAAGATVGFAVNNTSISPPDTVTATLTTTGGYSVTSYRVKTIVDAAGGKFFIYLTNESAGSLSEAVAINFTVTKGALA